MCFECSKEPCHRDGSFEYPQHMFWLRNKKNNFQLHTFILGPGVPIPLVQVFIIFYFSTKAYVVGTEKNRLTKTVPLSTQNKC